MARPEAARRAVELSRRLAELLDDPRLTAAEKVGARAYATAHDDSFDKLASMIEKLEARVARRPQAEEELST